jgi:hypothetical protein
MPKRWTPTKTNSFLVYSNGNGTFHILAVDENGGYIFADGFNSRDEADWAAGLFNAAIGANPD